MTSSARITITESDDLRILEIRNVTNQDSGVYKVTLENSYGKVEASARLEVITHRLTSSRGFRARSLSPNHTPTRTYNSSIRYGNNARLFYDIRSVPTSYLKYYTNNVEVKECSNTNETVLNDTFKGNKNSLCGKINNKTSVKFLSKIQRTTDDRLAPMILNTLPQTLKVTEGEQIVLKLLITGSQPFYVQWMKDGCVLGECDGFERSSIDGLIILIATKPSVKDSGCYTCRVYNNFGQISSSCHVIVCGKC